MALRLYLIIILSLICSCSKPGQKQEPEGTYFSIVEFAKDQWYTYHGQPYSIMKKVYFNGKVDSTITNALDLDWSSVIKVFFETDISDPKFVGQYDFSAFEDTTTVTKSFFYEAKEPKLFTRKLQITADYFTDKIKTIYIEAEKKDRMGTKSIKLFYTPLETISIQELETTKTGQKKELRVVYEFM